MWTSTEFVAKTLLNTDSIDVTLVCEMTNFNNPEKQADNVGNSFQVKALWTLKRWPPWCFSFQTSSSSNTDIWLNMVAHYQLTSQQPQLQAMASRFEEKWNKQNWERCWFNHPPSSDRPSSWLSLYRRRNLQQMNMGPSQGLWLYNNSSCEGNSPCTNKFGTAKQTNTLDFSKACPGSRGMFPFPFPIPLAPFSSRAPHFTVFKRNSTKSKW